MTRPLLTLWLALWLALCVQNASAQFNLNKLQDIFKKGTEIAKKAQEAFVEMSETDEVQTGDDIAASFLGAVPVHGDADLQRYVNRVGRWVASQSNRPDLKWSFAVLDTPTINAFAVPGGTIFVSAELLKQLSSEAELAGVLGHEIAHVMQRHHVKAIQANARQDLARQQLSDAVDRSGRVGALGKEGLKLAVSTGLNVFAKGLDKSDEFEADRIGAVLAARAGYDPYGLVAVLQKLSALKSEETGFSLMLSTHPNASDRLTELEKFAATFDKFAAQPPVAERFMKHIAALK